MYDICIIGGGASGMTAAIEARRERADLSICILEKKDRPRTQALRDRQRPLQSDQRSARRQG
ncbi:MAG: FAD-dependent oxidoreductase [Anaerovoracaceae bacterium]